MVVFDSYKLVDFYIFFLISNYYPSRAKIEDFFRAKIEAFSRAKIEANDVI